MNISGFKNPGEHYVMVIEPLVFVKRYVVFYVSFFIYFLWLIEKTV